MQTDLRRAVSTAYYAVFHTLANDCANLLLSKKAKRETRRAWQQAYRSLQHRRVKDVCEGTGRVKQAFKKFPDEIRDFGEAFCNLQRQRHGADYDPLFPQIKLSTANAAVDLAEQAIAAYRAATLTDRSAFVVFVAFDLRT